MTRPWRLIIVDESNHRALELSPVLAETIAESVASGAQPPTVLLRRQKPYVLLGPADTRLPGAANGVAWLREQGYPVFVRISGGSAVVLDETCLSFAVAIPCRDLTALRSNYERLAGGVIDGLARLGVQAYFAEVENTYCPGPYDLAAGGRKIAGIAQALRRGFAEVGGMVLVAQEPERAIELIEGFYKAAGQPRKFDPDRHTNLHRLCGRPVAMEEVITAIAGAYASRFSLVAADLSDAEYHRAHELLAQRQLR